MAKILIFNVPAYGHVNVTLPMTRELIQRGHEVIYYCTEQFEPVIKKTGATFRSYPEAGLSSQVISKLAHNLANISALLTNVSCILTDFVIKEIQHEAPDLVIYDIITLWARIGAIVTNTPTVATYSMMILEGVDGLFDKRILLGTIVDAIPNIPKLLWNRHKLAQAYGQDTVKFPLFPSRGDLNLVFLPREFQMDTSFIDSSFCFVGASINPALRDEPPLSLTTDNHPLIYISLGTVNNDNLAFYQQVINIFADKPVKVILSIGKQVQIDDLGVIPDNIHVFDSVPQLQVLNMADVFVTHGGMNSIQEAIYFGVPMVVFPQQTEQLVNGRRIQEIGAGLVIGDHRPYGQVSIKTLQDAIERVLSNAHFRENIELQRNASQNSGGYRRAVDEIEEKLKITKVKSSIR